MRFADKIMLLRKEKNVSQKQLAKALDVSRQSVYKWEADLSMPEIDKIKRMAEFFGISYEELLNDDILISFDNLSVSQEKTDNNDFNSPQKPSFKKPLIITLISLIIIVVIILTISIILFVNKKDNIPEEQIQVHKQHNLVMSSIIKEATCNEEGSMNIACTECDYKGVMVINKKAHMYENNVCVNCDAIEGTKGIEYVYSDEYNGYYVKSIGSCLEDNIVITNKYNGKEVVAIGKEAFASTHIKSVKIPDTVRIIEQKSFYQCKSLRSINLGNGVVIIGKYAFSSCSTLDYLITPSTLETIERYAFENTKILSLSLGENVKSIEVGAFSNSNIQLAELANIGKWSLTNAEGKEIFEIEILTPSKNEALAQMLYEKCGYYWVKSD